MSDGNHREEEDVLLRHGLKICLSGGDTLRPMGLLLLSELHGSDLAGKHDYGQALEIRSWLAETDSLLSSHFATILDLTDPEVLLDQVEENRAPLFPFSYR